MTCMRALRTLRLRLKRRALTYVRDDLLGGRCAGIGELFLTLKARRVRRLWVSEWLFKNHNRNREAHNIQYRLNGDQPQFHLANPLTDQIALYQLI